VVRPGRRLLSLVALGKSTEARRSLNAPSDSLVGICHHNHVTESMVRYDEIGRDYAAARHADPNISALIAHALGDSSSVVNVGAGRVPTSRQEAGWSPWNPQAS
jgi:hypothetical protein